MEKALMRFGLPIKQAGLPHGRPAQPRFGLSYRRQALINYKPEQRVIDAIVELKSQGMSLGQIARTLSNLKIPTKLSGLAPDDGEESFGLFEVRKFLDIKNAYSQESGTQSQPRLGAGHLLTTTVNRYVPYFNTIQFSGYQTLDLHFLATTIKDQAFPL